MDPHQPRRGGARVRPFAAFVLVLAVGCAGDGPVSDTALSVELEGAGMDGADVLLVSGDAPAGVRTREAVACHVAWLSSNGRALTGRILVGRSPVILRAGEIVADGIADHRAVSETLGAMVEAGSIDEFGRLSVRDDITARELDTVVLDSLSVPPSASCADAHLVLMYPVTLSKRVLVVQHRGSLRSASVDVLPVAVGSTDAEGRIDVEEYEGDVCDG